MEWKGVGRQFVIGEDPFYGQDVQQVYIVVIQSLNASL